MRASKSGTSVKSLDEMAGDRLRVCEQELLWAFARPVSISSNFSLLYTALNFIFLIAVRNNKATSCTPVILHLACNHKSLSSNTFTPEYSIFLSDIKPHLRHQRTICTVTLACEDRKCSSHFGYINPHCLVFTTS